MNIIAPNVEFTGIAGQYMSRPVIYDQNGTLLKAGVDYEKEIEYRVNGTILSPSSNVLAGDKVTAIVSAKEGGGYVGTITAEYVVTAGAQNIEKANLTGAISKEYTGKDIILSNSDIKLKLNSKTVASDGFEIVPESYMNNKNKGTASVYIKGVGDYVGVKKITFKILSQKIDK